VAAYAFHHPARALVQKIGEFLMWPFNALTGGGTRTANWRRVTSTHFWPNGTMPKSAELMRWSLKVLRALHYGWGLGRNVEGVLVR
jgi:hypothetical protein